jgi:CopG antitoxin of type II toxin-antitoxin system
MARHLKKIPEFRSREEEFDFWATHDSSEYETKAEEEGPGPRLVKIVYRKTRQGKATKVQRQ